VSAAAPAPAASRPMRASESLRVALPGAARRLATGTARPRRRADRARLLVAVINGENRTDVRVDAAIASPGDTLRFGPDVTANEDVGQLYVSWPARVISGYTVYYTLITPCGQFTTTTTACEATGHASNSPPPARLCPARPEYPGLDPTD